MLSVLSDYWMLTGAWGGRKLKWEGKIKWSGWNPEQGFYTATFCCRYLLYLTNVDQRSLSFGCPNVAGLHLQLSLTGWDWTGEKWNPAALQSNIWRTTWLASPGVDGSYDSWIKMDSREVPIPKELTIQDRQQGKQHVVEAKEDTRLRKDPYYASVTYLEKHIDTSPPQSLQASSF